MAFTMEEYEPEDIEVRKDDEIAAEEAVLKVVHGRRLWLRLLLLLPPVPRTGAHKAVRASV